MTEPIGSKVRGLNHLALVCSDMARTVDFYTNVLGFPLVKTVELPGGRGQHFFFDIGNGNGQTLAFFWFPDGPDTPEVVLLHVDSDSAEYWTSPGGTAATVLQWVKSKVAHSRMSVGESGTVEL